MAEEAAIVDFNLGVECHISAGRSSSEGVDFSDQCIVLSEKTIEGAKDAGYLLQLVTAKASSPGNVLRFFGR